MSHTDNSLYYGEQLCVEMKQIPKHMLQTDGKTRVEDLRERLATHYAEQEWNLKNDLKEVLYEGLYFSRYFLGGQERGDEPLTNLSLAECSRISKTTDNLFHLDELQVGYNYQKGTLLVRNMERLFQNGNYNNVRIRHFEYDSEFVKASKWKGLNHADLQKATIHAHLNNDKDYTFWKAIAEQVELQKLHELNEGNAKYERWVYEGPLTRQSDFKKGRVAFNFPERLMKRKPLLKILYQETKCDKLVYYGDFENYKIPKINPKGKVTVYRQVNGKLVKAMRCKKAIERYFIPDFNRTGGIGDSQQLKNPEHLF